ncbi:MAG: hypothetical protein AAF533_09725 [Acidobacteriota bacterium]
MTPGASISQESAPSRWLFGPAVDLLLGCGLGYIAIFSVLTVFGAELKLLVPPSVGPLLSLFIGAPHYGATLLRVYDTAEDRRRYLIHGGLITLVIWLAFWAGVHVGVVASALITIYLTWSPWHYSGQNFGIALMFLHKRGVPVSARARKLLHLSFQLSFGLAILPMHGASPQLEYQPSGLELDAAGFVSLGIPNLIGTVLFVVLGLAYLTTVVGAGVTLGRSARRWKDLVPTGLLVFTQSLWFVVPLVGQRVFGEVEALSSGYAFMWIALGHMVQYLWITTYFKRRESNAGGRMGFYLAALAAGGATWFLPAMIFAPHRLGDLTWDAGLGMLVASAVNIHHFVLDGAIWKLRSAPVANVLLSKTDGADAPSALGSLSRLGLRRLLRPAVLGIGALSVAGLYATSFESRYGLNGGLQRRDLERVDLAVERLHWLGRDSSSARIAAAELRARVGDPLEAIQQVEDVLRKDETNVNAWLAVGRLQGGVGNLELAIAAAERAMALEPTSKLATAQLGFELARAAQTQEHLVESALDFARQLVEASEGQDALSFRRLALAQAAAGLTDDARASALRARELAVTSEEQRLVEGQLAFLLP